jgi:hypothetical protein
MEEMRMDEWDARLLDPVNERIIGCAFRVANALGSGFVEKAHGSALFTSGGLSSFAMA